KLVSLPRSPSRSKVLDALALEDQCLPAVRRRLHHVLVHKALDVKLAQHELLAARVEAQHAPVLMPLPFRILLLRGVGGGVPHLNEFAVQSELILPLKARDARLSFAGAFPGADEKSKRLPEVRLFCLWSAGAGNKEDENCWQERWWPGPTIPLSSPKPAGRPAAAQKGRPTKRFIVRCAPRHRKLCSPRSVCIRFGPVTDATTLPRNSAATSSRIQRTTTTRSCSGSTKIMFGPAPWWAKLDSGAFGKSLRSVLRN